MEVIMIKDIKTLIQIILIGALIMVGMRTVEAIWPKPTKITVVYYVCFGENEKPCRRLTEKEVESLK